MRSIKLLLVMAMLVALAAFTAACGGAEEGGENGEGEDPAMEEDAAMDEDTAVEEDTAMDEAASGGGDSLVIYSGRSGELVGPIIDEFSETVDMDVQVRYGDTAELAATILEEGENSPADVYFAQDAGALGALQEEGLLADLPEELLEPVDERFVSPDGQWIGLSGRARVVSYNTDAVSEADLPDSILDFTEPEWKGRIGWAPTNGSFQAFITAMRLTEGEDVARDWLEGIQANNPTVYENNTSALEGIAAGEVDVGFINHYYLFQSLAEQGESFGARNYYPTGGDVGSMVNIAGAGILNTSENQEEAEQFLEYMLSEDAQQYFADETYEYPVIEGVESSADVPTIEEIDTPDIDLSNLEDLDGTLQLLQETGAL